MKAQEIKRIKILILTLCIVTLGLFLYKLSFQTDSHISDLKVEAIQNKLDKLEFENNKMQIEIDDLSSYRIIASRASELGFEDSKKDMYLVIRR